ncbi:site-specific integrase [Bacillus toyonensis]|uniref:Site-specific integrase n=1 Tax=Bacillus toyonensis TaxID=155322 RepID=A0A2C4R730_9BACI|nr:site-specific integrase [Bacillus toyonensis]PGB03867.1 site-specific integrase [Bacillus toyonensis]PHD72540.1 site-specific integrase [Bacillus toyonensis]
MASFRKRNDKWKYRIRYKEMGKYKETSKGGFKTKKEAQLAAAKIEEKIASGVNMQDSHITFHDYMYEWLDIYKKDSVSPRTYYAYHKNIRKYILPEFGTIKIKDLTQVRYQQFINNLLIKLHKQTVNVIHATIHGALNTAMIELNIINKNPTDKIQMKTRQIIPAQTEIKCYDVDELQDFLDFVLHTKKAFKYYSLFMFLSRTGLRIGECLALQWTDINFQKGTLSINKTLLSVKRNQSVTFGPPKNKSSNRVLSLDTTTLNLLKKIKNKQSKNILKHGNYYADYQFIFTHENSSCMLPAPVLCFLQRACKEGNFKYITLHGFRHTHAVHLLQSGANIKYVSGRLGHSTIDMTANVYLHVTKSIDETSVDQYDQFLKSRGQIVGKQ